MQYVFVYLIVGKGYWLFTTPQPELIKYRIGTAWVVHTELPSPIPKSGEELGRTAYVNGFGYSEIKQYCEIGYTK